MAAPDKKELQEANTFWSRISLINSRGLTAIIIFAVTISVSSTLFAITATYNERISELKKSDALRNVIEMLVTSGDSSLQEAIMSYNTIRDAAKRLSDSKEKDVILEASDRAQSSLSTLDANIRRMRGYVGEMRSTKIGASSFSFDLSIIGKALAQSSSDELKRQLDDAKVSEEIMKAKVRFWAYIGILLSLLIVLIGSIVALFVTTDDKRFAAALDVMKLLIGFFIGVMSSFFGLPA